MSVDMHCIWASGYTKLQNYSKESEDRMLNKL